MQFSVFRIKAITNGLLSLAYLVWQQLASFKTNLPNSPEHKDRTRGLIVAQQLVTIHYTYTRHNMIYFKDTQK
jgi:hypothetical protein